MPASFIRWLAGYRSGCSWRVGSYYHMLVLTARCAQPCIGIVHALPPLAINPHPCNPDPPVKPWSTRVKAPPPTHTHTTHPAPFQAHTCDWLPLLTRRASFQRTSQDERRRPRCHAAPPPHHSLPCILALMAVFSASPCSSVCARSWVPDFLQATREGGRVAVSGCSGRESGHEGGGAGMWEAVAWHVGGVACGRRGMAAGT